MRASCSIIIPRRVTSTSATSAIGASTRIAVMRRRQGLPDAQPDSRRAERRSYPSPGDREWLDRLDGADYVVFSVSAELPDRDVPAHWSNSQSRICCCPCWLPLSALRSARAARSLSGRARLLTVPGSPWRCAGRSASFAVTPRSTCWLGCFIRNRSTTGTSRAATVGLRHQLRGVLARPIR